MSYLDRPRLHFAGRFHAAPATANNSAANYDPGKFTGLDAIPSTGGKRRFRATEAGWCPLGTNIFELRDCVVTSVCFEDRTVATSAAQDTLVGTPVLDGGRAASAKLVDLDPAQQNVSEIWGLEIKVGSEGPGWLRRKFKAAALADLWPRFPAGGGDNRWGGTYHSNLIDVDWSPGSKSRFFEELSKFQDGAPPRQLSIKLVLDQFCDDPNSPDFTHGRIVGTIGRVHQGEPESFLLGRELRRVDQSPLHYAYAKIDGRRNTIIVDLGNSIPTVASARDARQGGASTGAPSIPAAARWGEPDRDRVGELALAFRDGANGPIVIGPVAYGDAENYCRTAGIIEVPDARPQVNNYQTKPLVIIGVHSNSPLLEEHSKGHVVRAEPSVIRLNPDNEVRQGETPVTVQLIATEFGKRLALPAPPAQPAAIALPAPAVELAPNIVVKLDYVDYERYRLQEPGQDPVGTPTVALEVSATQRQNKQKEMKLTARDPLLPDPPDPLGQIKPHPPRAFVDGQFYAIGYTLDDEANETTSPNPGNYISVRVFNETKPHGKKPTWSDDVYPIFRLYVNLYPAMRQVLDLGNYADVVKHKELIGLALERPFDDSNHMPVTRDLSHSKRDIILAWLKQPRPLAQPTTETLEDLRGALQKAMALEHATIPAYLAALYSIKSGKNQEVADILQSIVIEEMLHLTLVANLLIAVGGKPVLNARTFVPWYPTDLSFGLRPGCVVGLERCSRNLIKNVFMEFEEPKRVQEGVETGAIRGNPAIEVNPHSIGEFYRNVGQAIINLDGAGNIWQNQTNQVEKNLGQVRQIHKITDAATAQQALRLIVDQGEGASATNPDAEAVQKVKAGKRSELAHYYRLAEIAFGRRITEKEPSTRRGRAGTTSPILEYLGEAVPFDDDGVWPVARNLHAAHLTPGSAPRIRCDQFNRTYTRLLAALHEAFNGTPRRLDDAFGLMFELKLHAKALVEMRIGENPAGLDPNLHAGPTFEYVDGV